LIGLVDEVAGPTTSSLTKELKPALEPVTKPVEQTVAPLTRPVQKVASEVVAPVTQPVVKAVASPAVERLDETVVKPVSKAVSSAVRPVAEAVSGGGVSPSATDIIEATAPQPDEQLEVADSDTSERAVQADEDLARAGSAVMPSAMAPPTAKQDAPSVQWAPAPAPQSPESPQPLMSSGASASAAGSSPVQVATVATEWDRSPLHLVGVLSPDDVRHQSQDASRPETSPG